MASGVETSARLYGRPPKTVEGGWRLGTSSSRRPSSADDLICAKLKRHTQLGRCPTRNSRYGEASSTSRRRGSSTAVNLLMTHRRNSPHGTRGARIGGRRRSSDPCSYPCPPGLGRPAGGDLRVSSTTP